MKIGKAADVSFGIINMIKLFSVGIIAAATMVVPGVSGSMMLMLLGYYDAANHPAANVTTPISNVTTENALQSVFNKIAIGDAMIRPMIA